MGLRQTFKDNKSIALVFLSLAILGALIYVFFGRGAAGDKLPGRHQFYSDDDGATWFTDDASKGGSFMRNGKQAVIARVFKCGDGRAFVGYLEKRIGHEAEAALPATPKTLSKGGTPAAGPVFNQSQSTNGIMIKKPGTGNWVSSNDPGARAVRQFTCPDGSTDFVPVPP